MTGNTVMVGKGTSKVQVDVGGLMTSGKENKVRNPVLCDGEKRI